MSEEVELLVIGNVSHDRFYLDATGGWSSTSVFKTKLHSQKASARLHHNGEPAIQAVWDSMERGAAKIQNTKKTKGANRGHTLFEHGDLRIRHVLFEVSTICTL